ncbi:sensor histidine kinase [Sphingomonas sp. RS2018]
MTIVPRSIHGRMLALSALATVVALAIAGAAIWGVLAGFVAEGFDQRLDAEISLMASTVQRDGSVNRARLERLRPALEGRHGWRWRIAGPAGTVSSADFPDLEVDRGREGRRRHDPRPPGDGGPRPVEGRDRNDRPFHARTLTIDSASGPVVLTAAAPRRMVLAPIRGALLPLLATLAILGATLGGAAVLSLRIGLRPLRRLRDDIAAIRSGRRQVLDEDQPDELRPLASELNALLHESGTALEVARASAANLAHALKTPVATLALELRDDPPRAAQVERIYATIRHHLARARGSFTDTRAATPLAPAVADLVGTIDQLHADRALTFTHVVPADLTVAIDAADLTEILGNLIDNAARHATTRVSVSAERSGTFAAVTVRDDGPGIPAPDRARAMAPGIRLDERSSDGDGFGLAIARDLAALHGGRLTLDEAPGGGLLARVAIRLSRID